MWATVTPLSATCCRACSNLEQFCESSWHVSWIDLIPEPLDRNLCADIWHLDQYVVDGSPQLSKKVRLEMSVRERSEDTDIEGSNCQQSTGGEYFLVFKGANCCVVHPIYWNAELDSITPTHLTALLSFSRELTQNMFLKILLSKGFPSTDCLILSNLSSA